MIQKIGVVKIVFVYILLMFVCGQSAYSQPETIINFPSPSSVGLTYFGSITDAAVNNNNNIWVGLLRNGVLHFDGTNWARVCVANTQGFTNDTVNIIENNSANGIWVGTTTGVFKVDTNVAIHFPFDSNGLFPKAKIIEIKAFNNELFVASDSGVSVLNLTNLTWTRFDSLNSSLPTNLINSFSLDPTGNVWFSYNNGYAIYNNGTINVFSLVGTSIQNCIIYDIAITQFDTLFYASNVGIVRFVNGNFNSIGDYFYKPVSTNFCDTVSYTTTYEKDTFFGKKYFAIDDSSNVYLNMLNLGIICVSKKQEVFKRYVTTSSDVYSNYVQMISNSWDKMFLFPFNSPRNILSIETIETANNYFKLIESEFDSVSTTPMIDIPASKVYSKIANLNANNINARILNTGNLHLDFGTSRPAYFPSSSAVTLWGSAIWFSGLDSSSQLYTAVGEIYESQNADFWPGPINNVGTIDSITVAKFDNIWMTNRSEIDEFRYQYSIGNVSNGTYQVSDYILQWPAYYNATAYPQNLAPFVDFNADGLYNPFDGDYPDIKGDQMAWWVFNDVFGNKTSSNSLPMKVEIHGSAYAYSCSDFSDSLLGLNFTTFYHYDIYNRSYINYDSCFFGFFSEFDLGNPGDDCSMCNLFNNSFGVYNGDSDDNIGNGGFGVCPPNQNFTFLKTPEAPLNDGNDNDHNGQIDEANEELGLSGFVRFQDGPGAYESNPINSIDFYRFLNSTWLNGIPITYGGNGQGTGIGSTNIPTKYMFSGNSNTQFPNEWNMSSSGFQPTDERGVGSSGPFNLPVGGRISFDIASITGPTDSSKNQQIVTNLRALFRNGKFENFKGTIPNIVGPKQVATSTNIVNYSVSLPNANNTFLWTVTNGIIQNGQGTNSIDVIWGTAGVGSVVLEAFGANNPCRGEDSITINIGLTSNQEIANEITVRIFPNPTKNTLQIETNGQKIDRAIIYNLEGKIVLQQTYIGTINTFNLNSGAYILELLNQQNQSVVRKLFVKE